MDLKILGDRLRQVRLLLGLTQKQLAEATHLNQSVISRLESGDEVYASVLLRVLYYYEGKISIDFLLSHSFSPESNRLSISRQADALANVNHQLQTIADMIDNAHSTALEQIERLRKSTT